MTADIFRLAVQGIGRTEVMRRVATTLIDREEDLLTAPRYADLAQWAGVSERTFRRVLHLLEQLGGLRIDLAPQNRRLITPDVWRLREILECLA